MNWENIDNDFEEEKEPDQDFKQQKDLQLQSLLRNCQDPAQDPKRQEYIHLLSNFNHFLLAGQIEEIANTLINEDAQLFIASSVKGLPARNFTGPKGFIELYKDRRVVERSVRTVSIDQEKCTAVQICNYKIAYEDNNEPSEEFAFEIFTINDGKISKYRASFASLTPAHNHEDPFVLTRNDHMLAKVKMINYALAGQPDFDKVASLLHEKTEYTILGWEADKFLTLYQHNFASEFKELEGKFSIKCIIPYELYTGTQESQTAAPTKIVISTYVYNLEEKATGKPYVWLSTCAYAFDENINLAKVSQQGELYPEDEVEIPFESMDREKLAEKMYNFSQTLKPNLDIFYSDLMHYDCKMSRFGPHDLPNSRHFHGLDEIHELLSSLGPPYSHMDWIVPIDVFVDLHHPSYEIIIAVIGIQGTMLYEDYKYKGQNMNFINFVMIAFENGKVAKFVQFFSEVPYPIPSPFDDENFSAMNFKRLRDINNEEPNPTSF